MYPLLSACWAKYTPSSAILVVHGVFSNRCREFSDSLRARLYPLSEEERVGYDHRQSATER
jgi:hypothetical protein